METIRLSEGIIKQLNKKSLKEESYKIAPSYNDNEGYGSVSNSEAIEAAQDVVRYFRDYAEFLGTDKGSRYVDASMIDDFNNLANNLEASINDVMTKWNNL